MISLQETLFIHEILINEFGGAMGLRDQGLLESALQRPHSMFDGKELYPDPIHKAAVLIEGIVRNHPFLDGNKRVGYTLMRLQLIHAGLDVKASQKEKFDFVIEIASGETDLEATIDWIQNHVIET